MVSLKHIEVETQGHIILATFRGLLTAEEFQYFLDKFEQQLQSATKRVLISDHTELEALPVDLRKQLVEFRQANADRYPAAFYGLAYVQPTAVIRGALTATFWLSKPTVPTQVFATLGEARAWADEISRKPS